ncbi:unnamed protein product [Rotaria sordida]|uniref:Clathrin light chain n=1 Tax=Rotaria sordida TaxID=392033 RepID=A0A813WV57_9BILA|nr:unnamed protein product [Rotaria sordida]
MDDFDLFTQPLAETQVSGSQNTNIPEDDFFGAGNTTNVINTAPIDTFSNNPPEDSWVLDDNFNNAPTSETTILSEKTLTNLDSASQLTSFDDGMLTNQLNTNELDSYATNNLPSATNDIFYNDTNNLSSTTNDFLDVPTNNLSSTTNDFLDVPTNNLSSTTNDFLDVPTNNFPSTTNDFLDVPTNNLSSTTNDVFDNVTNNLPSPTNDDLYNDTTTLQSEETTSSYDMFSQPVPTPTPIDTNTFTTGISSQEKLSALEAFNNRRQREIAEKDVEEKQKIEALRQQAKGDLERWYRERKSHMEQNRLTMKNAEDALRTTSLEKSDKNSCDWSKVLRFVELSQGTQLSKGKRDLTRMKTIILNAKRDNDKRISANGV